jgi:dihydrodipicolinate synthase/N-acetylneuraminate lyase
LGCSDSSRFVSSGSSGPVSASPIRVLHEAVRLAGIADTGPLLPLLSNLPEADHAKVREAAARLLAEDRR